MTKWSRSQREQAYFIFSHIKVFTLNFPSV
jgi:hypothetical protein